MHGAKGSRAKVDMGGELSIKHAADGSLVITHKPEEPAQFSGEPASLKTAVAKVKPVALTAVGAGAGLLVAGPIGALVGAGVGGAIDWYRHRKAPMASSATAAAATGGGGEAPNLPAGIANLRPITMAALTKTAPNISKLRLIKMATAANLSTHPATVNPDPNTVAAKQAADALYGYFQQYPYDRMLGDIFWKSSKTGALVIAFQTAYNADAATNVATGPLSVSGFYDTPTAGALTFYTHNPVDPDPNT